MAKKRIERAAGSLQGVFLLTLLLTVPVTAADAGRTDAPMVSASIDGADMPEQAVTTDRLNASVRSVRSDGADVPGPAGVSGRMNSSEASGSGETAGQPAGAEGAEEHARPADTGNEGTPSSRTVAGTAVLVGAGAYTYLRTKWKEKENEKTKEQKYVYFENHTRNGTLREEEKYPDINL